MESPTISPLINRASLSEQAYSAIKQLILDLTLKPGEPITEAQLSSMLNISKSPIRSALIHLQRDGLVTTTPYKETIVTVLSVDTVRQVYEARALIEPHVVSMVTPLLTAADFDVIEDMLARAELALINADFPAFFVVNGEFHGYFIKRSGNELFWTMFQVAESQMHRIRMISASIMDHPRKQMDEHRQIYNAAHAGDAQAAAEAMRAHIVGFLADLFAEIEAGNLPWLNNGSALLERRRMSDSVAERAETPGH